jgi:hypothetical protein
MPSDDDISYRWPDDQPPSMGKPVIPDLSPSLYGYGDEDLPGAPGGAGSAWATGILRGLGQLAEGAYEGTGGVIRDVMTGQLQPGSDDAITAAANTALAYGLPGGAPAEEGVLASGAKGLMKRADQLQDVPKKVAKLRQGRTFPEYAEQYPPVGPPTPTLDWNKSPPGGKMGPFMFQKKTPLPEVKPFLREREKIMQDMAKNPEGWTPYFDPAKRFDVDPSNYAHPLDTGTVVPKKQATIDEHMKKIGSPEARARLRQAYAKGLTMKDTERWYALGQLEEAFIKELGPVEGRKQFSDRIAAGMATVTAGNDPGPNYLLSHYLNYLRHWDKPYPTEPYNLPYPVGGGKYGVMPNVRQHQKIMDAGGFSGLDLTNPKRYDFAHSFTGDLSRPVMDEQMVGRMVPGVSAPGQDYGLFAGVTTDEAKKAGVTEPGRYQDVAWAGLKNLKTPQYTEGKPFIQEVNEAIERTHRLTGMPREEIVRRGVIRNEIPLYGQAGLGTGGLLGDWGLGNQGDQQ